MQLAELHAILIVVPISAPLSLLHVWFLFDWMPSWNSDCDVFAGLPLAPPTNC